MNNKRGPWMILKSKVVYKNPWIKVREDSVVRPDGKKGIYGTIDIKPGVLVLPVDDKQNTYLVKEFLYPHNKYSLETIGGGIKKDETILQAAKRELQEEAGITAKEWIYLGYEKPLTSFTKMTNHIFLATNLTFTQNRLEGTEVIKIIKLPFKKAVDLVFKNKIEHSGTQIAILKAKEKFKYKNL